MFLFSTFTFIRNLVWSTMREFSTRDKRMLMWTTWSSFTIKILYENMRRWFYSMPYQIKKMESSHLLLWLNVQNEKCLKLSSILFLLYKLSPLKWSSWKNHLEYIKKKYIIGICFEILDNEINDIFFYTNKINTKTLNICHQICRFSFGKN